MESISNESLFKKITLKKGEQILYKFDLEGSKKRLGIRCIFYSIICFLCFLCGTTFFLIASTYEFDIFVAPDTPANTIFFITFAYILPLLFIVASLLITVLFIFLLRVLIHRISDYLNAPESLIKYYNYLVFTNKGIYSNLDNKDRYILWDEIEWCEIDNSNDNGPDFAIKLKEKKDKIYLNIGVNFWPAYHHKTQDMRHAADDAYSTYKKSLNGQQDDTNIDALDRHSIMK